MGSRDIYLNVLSFESFCNKDTLILYTCLHKFKVLHVFMYF